MIINIIIDTTKIKRNKLHFKATLRPYFDHGKMAGIRVKDIQPGSLFLYMEIDNGDVINRIDGYPITTIEDSFGLYNALETQTYLSLDIKRNQTLKTINYEFK